MQLLEIKIIDLFVMLKKVKKVQRNTGINFKYIIF